MPVDSISSGSPIMSARPLTTLSRSPETTPDARESSRQENEARRVATAQSGASPALSGPDSARISVIAVPEDAAGAQRAASSQIARAYQEAGSSQIRGASDAYQAQANARDDMARAQQDKGLRGIDISV
jgi:hypothetical protein